MSGEQVSWKSRVNRGTERGTRERIEPRERRWGRNPFSLFVLNLNAGFFFRETMEQNGWGNPWPLHLSQPASLATRHANARRPFSSLHRVPSRVFHPFHNDFSNELQSLAIPEYPHRRLQGAFDSSAFFPRERKPPTKREIRVGSFLFFFFCFSRIDRELEKIYSADSKNSNNLILEIGKFGRNLLEYWKKKILKVSKTCKSKLFRKIRANFDAKKSEKFEISMREGHLEIVKTERTWISNNLEGTVENLKKINFCKKKKNLGTWFTNWNQLRVN